ncbi:MAG: response regulator transcription factor, partial [Bdellovibrionales bacterium]|nr:response regulator transcription factor [Bdellovibrionales bacterium]
MKQRLVYIDDNLSNLDCIGLIFEREFSVETFQNPIDFLKQFQDSLISAILVDIHMPIMNGFALYEKIIEHEKYNGCPIVFISSDDTDASRIKSFSLGAVDFIDRKINPSEMLTRLKSQITFFQKHRKIVELGNLKLNMTLLKAYLNEVEVKLTFIEFKLLCYVVKKFPELTEKEQIMESVWSNAH